MKETLILLLLILKLCVLVSSFFGQGEGEILTLLQHLCPQSLFRHLSSVLRKNHGSKTVSEAVFLKKKSLFWLPPCPLAALSKFYPAATPLKFHPAVTPPKFHPATAPSLFSEILLSAATIRKKKQLNSATKRN